MKNNKIIIFILFIFSSAVFYAQDFDFLRPNPENKEFKNFRGRRMPDENFHPREFELLGLRFYEENENVCLDLVFSKEIDPSSVNIENIFINEKTYRSGKILFTKNSRVVRIIILKNEVGNLQTSFDILVKGIKSFDGNEHPDIVLSDIPVNSDYKYFKRDNIWKKSLL